jgi:hypothetical protein
VSDFKRDQVLPIWYYLRVYRCVCGWSGDNPSITDTSEPIEGGGTQHICLCPVCLEPV